MILVDQIFWTQNVTEALDALQGGRNAKAMEDFLEYTLQQVRCVLCAVMSCAVLCFGVMRYCCDIDVVLLKGGTG